MISHQIRFIALICIVLCTCFQNANAQNGTPIGSGSRSLAMGDAGVGLRDINSLFNNQAGLAFLEDFGATFNGERRFLANAINSFSVGAALPMKVGTFGIDINYFGFDAYNEQKIGLAYSRKIWEKISIGAQIDYINFRIPEYGSRGVLTFELGVMAELLPKLWLGAHVYSPLKVAINETENLPSVFSFGAAYQPNNKVTLSLEAEKDIDFDMAFKGGIEYQIAKPLCIRFGAASNPTLFSFGLGVNVQKYLRIDLSAVYYQILGITPGLSVVYLPSKKK